MTNKRTSVRQRVAARVRRQAHRGHVVAARALRRPRLSTPPVLVMGTARSGTSFVGATLAHANEVIYLREPITEPMFRRFPRAPLVNRLHEDPPPTPLLSLADAAFSGRVPFTPQVSIRPRDAWSPDVRTLVVKEVQPLASPWLVRRYGPRFVALFRHPAAIAASWWGRGWGAPVHEEIFRERFRRDGIGSDPAERLGAVIAVHEQTMLEVAAGQTDAIRVRYEDIAADPARQVRDLYAQLELTWSPDIDATIRATTSGRETPGAPRHLIRHARARIDAWRERLDPGRTAALRRGYERSGGSMYLDEW